MKRLLTLRTLITLLGAWLGISTTAVVIIALVGAPPNTRAVLLMGAGLVLLWVLLDGGLMFRLREPIRAAVLRIRLDWRLKFVLFATLLALLEEAVTTGMTNLAPLFGVPLGAAYITASANYLDVVTGHSVVVFVPMFVGWAFLLQRLDFTPAQVFLLYGLTGLTAEIMFGGWQALSEFGLWIFVYGLMVFLPAYTLPPERGARPPRWWHFPAAVFVPVLFAIPVAAIVGILHPVSIHFPPIPPGS